MSEQENVGKGMAAQQLSDALERAEANRRYPDSGFVADANLMDELRAQYSVFSPEGERHLTDLAEAVNGSLTERYDRFIPDDVLDYSAGIVDRFLCVSQSDYHGLYQLWDNPSGEIKDEVESSRGFFEAENGRIIVFAEPPFWNPSPDPSPEEQMALEKVGGVENIRRRIATTYFVNMLAHEIVHEYHEDDLPFSISEAGTDYYAENISAQFGVTYGYIIGYGDAPKAFYAELVSKYGDDMHKLFFGSPINPQIEQQIHGEFTSEKKKELFPEYFF